MDPAGLYLAHGPLVLLLWVGRGVSPEALRQLFNTTSFSLLPPGEVRTAQQGGGIGVGWSRILSDYHSRLEYQLLDGLMFIPKAAQ